MCGCVCVFMHLSVDAHTPAQVTKPATTVASSGTFHETVRTAGAEGVEVCGSITVKQLCNALLERRDSRLSNGVVSNCILLVTSPHVSPGSTPTGLGFRV